MNDKLFDLARKILNPLWLKACLRGSSCWGFKNPATPYSGRNLILAMNGELVVVSQNKQGRFVIHEFCKTSKTNLGSRVGELLNKAGLSFIKAASLPPEMSPQDIMLTSDGLWHCPKCKKWCSIDLTISHQRALQKAYQQHEAVSPDCHAANIKLYQVIDDCMIELQCPPQVAGAKMVQ